MSNIIDTSNSNLSKPALFKPLHFENNPLIKANNLHLTKPGLMLQPKFSQPNTTRSNHVDETLNLSNESEYKYYTKNSMSLNQLDSIYLDLKNLSNNTPLRNANHI